MECLTSVLQYFFYFLLFTFYFLLCQSQLIHVPCQLAFQVCCFILMDNALFSQSVNEGGNFRHFFACCFRFLDGLQVTDRIPGCFAIITVAIPAFGSLSYVFFRCLMIGHAFRILDGKGRKNGVILKNIQEVSFADICEAI
jgi:hypothetical protein